MTLVNSWNEWDPLKHVIVGAVENANIPPMEPARLSQKLVKIVVWQDLTDHVQKSQLIKQIYN